MLRDIRASEGWFGDCGALVTGIPVDYNFVSVRSHRRVFAPFQELPNLLLTGTAPQGAGDAEQAQLPY